MPFPSSIQTPPNDMQHLLEKTQNLLEEHKASQLQTYDVSKSLSYTDYMTVACGNSMTHLNALFQKVKYFYKQQGLIPYPKSLQENDEGWFVLDYDQIIIHLMSEDKRTYYDLDRLILRQGATKLTP